MYSTTTPIVDVRGLTCPQPFQRATAEAMMLSAGESFKLHISILPQPLLDYLTQRNFLYKVVSTAEGEFMVEITAQQSSVHQGEPVTVPIVCNTSAL